MAPLDSKTSGSKIKKNRPSKNSASLSNILVYIIRIIGKTNLERGVLFVSH